jgi:hypothetical protein
MEAETTMILLQLPVLFRDSRRAVAKLMRAWEHVGESVDRAAL